jgi:hypothetical protein
MTINKSKSKRKSKRRRAKTLKKTMTSSVIRKATIFFPTNSFLYKQKMEKQYKLRKNQFEWFSEIYAYGTSYGSFIDTYQLTKKIKLLDLGHIGIRAWLMKEFLHVEGGNLCDEQYSGSSANAAFHQSIQAFLDQYGFQGTIVRESSDSMDCGPSEVVLTPHTTAHIEMYMTLVKEEEEE